jgi:hypothetical protein
MAFHLEGPGLATRDAQDRATAALVERVTARGDVMLSGCVAEGRALARICVLSFRTRRREMEIAIAQVAAEAAALLAEARAMHESSTPHASGTTA